MILFHITSYRIIYIYIIVLNYNISYFIIIYIYIVFLLYYNISYMLF